MMGRQEVKEALFYRFRIEDYVPTEHLLRRIDWLLDFGAIRRELEALYSHTGRPSVDPGLMIRMLLIGYPKTIRVDQGSELVTRTLDIRAYQRCVSLGSSRPGMPTDNAFI